MARILRNDAQYIKETPSLAAAETARQRGRSVWIALVEGGIADGTFRDDLDADVVVRAMWDGVLSSIRWFPPLGHADPVEIGGQLADFYLPRIAGADGAPVRRRQLRHPSDGYSAQGGALCLTPIPLYSATSPWRATITE